LVGDVGTFYFEGKNLDQYVPKSAPAKNCLSLLFTLQEKGRLSFSMQRDRFLRSMVNFMRVMDSNSHNREICAPVAVA